MTVTQNAENGPLEEWPPADPAVRERLSELPPSAKLVARTLTNDGALSQADIAERSLLPPRTVRYGLDSLEDAQLLAARPSLEDARKRVYVLHR